MSVGFLGNAISLHLLVAALKKTVPDDLKSFQKIYIEIMKISFGSHKTGHFNSAILAGLVEFKINLILEKSHLDTPESSGTACCSTFHAAVNLIYANLGDCPQHV